MNQKQLKKAILEIQEKYFTPTSKICECCHDNGFKVYRPNLSTYLNEEDGKETVWKQEYVDALNWFINEWLVEKN